MIALVACAALALAPQAAADGDFVADLYSKRLLFQDDGAPLVPIGLMQGKDRVELLSSAGLTVTFGAGEATFTVPAATPLVLVRERGRAAAVKRRYVVDTLEGPARLTRRARLEQLQKAGVVVEALETGGVYGVKGTVVDTRAVLLLSPSAPPSLSARAVPIEVLEGAPSVVVRAQGAPASGPYARVRSVDGGPITVRQVEHSKGYAEHGHEDRVVRGEIAVVPDQAGRLAVVNLIDEDAMVAGVLPSEMFATAPMEALKAQAVTARGELFSKIGRRHFTEPYQVCAEQHCQVYRGMGAEHPRAGQAAFETRGELAFVGDQLVDSVYSACCGGHTEANDVVWDKPPHKSLVGRVDAPRGTHAPLPSPEHSALFQGVGQAIAADLSAEPAVRAMLEAPREAAWCGRSSFNQKGDAWRWVRRFERAELTAVFADLGVGDVNRIAVIERGRGGRLRTLLVQGTKGEARVQRELPVRRRLNNLRSGLFVVDEERDPRGVLVAVTLRGAGFGHGSGMCQQGAIGMAEAGADYRSILGHYYDGAVVRRVF